MSTLEKGNTVVTRMSSPESTGESETDKALDEAVALKRLRRKENRAKRKKKAESAGKEIRVQSAGREVEQPIRPPVGRAVIRKRHIRLSRSFVLLVLAPIVVAGIYLWGFAEDQYASTTGFTVRQEQAPSSLDLTGLSQFVGGSTSSDTDILYEFIQSQEIVQTVHERLDLPKLYSGAWESDPVFALWPDATIEDMLWYWNRMVRIAYDQGTGLIELRVLAFDPEDAQNLAIAIVEASQTMVNELNISARQDSMRYALADLEDAFEQMRESRLALTKFRTRTRIVDPAADIQGRMGVLNGLQLRLTDALVEFDLLHETTLESDPRVIQMQRRIDVIRERISEERENFAQGDIAEAGGDYPSLISEFEGLVVDLEYAAARYTAARSSVDVARSNADRQTRYLATYIRPTLAQSAEFPQRLVILALLGLFMLMSWTIFVLVYYSLRDRR